MKSFSDFQKNVDFDKLAYDVAKTASDTLKQPSELFTQEQYAFLAETVAVMSLSLLRQYHEWLNETQQSSFRKDP